ncbi:acyltransferase family protein [Actinoplanes sp. GCM10030250]|uniref:acyltransferase family protein n=1 Tax=Actinoplanes sp. GCM10030250 TaxID=3273376 RepID=UPI0036185FBA
MTAPRLAWLDGLRAVAVLLVVYAHLTRYVFTDLRAFTGEWLHAGTAGVMLFFLVSGYIIPASLERHGDLRAFWRSRACRLFPLYLVVLLPFAGSIDLVAHATMLPFLLGVPPATPVLWTLSFEMAFYLLVSGLFALRLHRLDGWVAMGLAGLAVITAPLAFTGAVGVPVAAVLLVAGLAAMVSGRRWAVVGGGVLLGGLAMTLLMVNQDPSHAWDGLLIVAVMFTGTTIHRADRGQTGWWLPAVTGTVVGAALLANWLGELVSLDALTPRYVARSMITLLVFGGVFAIGMGTRRWRTPAWLARIGVLSYSIYLVHYVLIQMLQPFLRSGLPDAVVAAGYLALVFGISWLTYRYVEVPGQRLGSARGGGSGPLADRRFPVPPLGGTGASVSGPGAP